MHDAPRYGEPVWSWEKKAAWPMLGLALISVGVFVEVVADTRIEWAESWWANALFFVDLAIMLVFAAEFAYRIWLVPHGLRLRYVLANPIDVILALVLGAQPLRLIRSARALRTLRAVRTVTVVGKGSLHSIVAVTRDRIVHADQFPDHRDCRGCLRVLVLRRADGGQQI